MRAMTLNVAHGARRPVPPSLLGSRAIARNLDAIGASIAAARPDVVALQEVDRECAYAAHVDHLARIASASTLGFAVHAPHGENARMGMLHGHALLARAPLAHVEDRRFARRFCHDKGFVVATIDAPDVGAVDVVSVHLEPFAPGVRRAQIDELVLALHARREASERPLVVMGDMNTGRRGVEPLWRGLDLVAFEPTARRPTFPARRPVVRLDWIFVSRDLRIVSLDTLRDRVSDHAPVVAEIARV
jgi:endonuclease/exonuclease/phosphatase family metal-dependent hydrolase